MAVDVIVLISIDLRRCRRLDLVELCRLIHCLQRQLSSLLGSVVDSSSQPTDSVRLISAFSQQESSQKGTYGAHESCLQHEILPIRASREPVIFSRDAVLVPRAEVPGTDDLPSIKSWLCHPHQAANLTAWRLLNLIDDFSTGRDSSIDEATELHHHDHEELVVQCRTALNDSLRGRNGLQIHVLFLALRCVAVSFRRLDPKELFDAVMTAVAGDHNNSMLPYLGVEDSHDLMLLCSNLLIVREDGDVDFFRRPMKQFMLNAEPSGKLGGHRTMTQICFRQIKRILQPWKDIIGLVAEIAAHPFLRYARRYWQAHYSMGESLENELPAQLLNIIELEITDLPEEGFLSIEIHRMTVDLGLDLAIQNGWTALQRICEQMGGVSGRSTIPGIESESRDDSTSFSHLLKSSTKVPWQNWTRSESSLEQGVSWEMCCIDDTGAYTDSSALPCDRDQWVSVSLDNEVSSSVSWRSRVEDLSTDLQALLVGEEATGRHEFNADELRYNDPVTTCSEDLGWEFVHIEEPG